MGSVGLSVQVSLWVKLGVRVGLSLAVKLWVGVLLTVKVGVEVNVAQQAKARLKGLAVAAVAPLYCRFAVVLVLLHRVLLLLLPLTHRRVRALLSVQVLLLALLRVLLALLRVLLAHQSQLIC